MRLREVETGHRLGSKLIMLLIRVITRQPPDEMFKALMYRPAFFGKAHTKFGQAVFRDKGELSYPERELLFAFASKMNQCSFCVSFHTTVASFELDPALVQAVLEDWREAPVAPKLKALMGFMEKLMKRPGEVTAADVKPLREAGVADESIERAIYLCTMACYMNTLASALDLPVPPIGSAKSYFAHMSRAA